MGALTCKLYDLQSNELADISEIALERSIKRIIDGQRTFTIQSFAKHPLFTTVPEGGDGYPNLWTGNRKLVVWEDGITDPIFHGRIFGAQRVAGAGKKVPITITAYTPDMEMGFEADERAGRPVRGSTIKGGDYDGNFINPQFVSSVDGGDAISGPDLLLQVLTNSENTGAESDPTPGEGPHPIDLTGDFDLDVPPAVDLSCIEAMDWPVLIGDFTQQLVQTGVCDYDLRMLAPGAGSTPYKMVELTSKSRIGTDRSGTVAFEWGTGAFNASAAKHEQDFSKICNKLYDYLAPRLTKLRWKGNITPGSPGTLVDPSASRTLYGGQFMWLRMFDQVGTENSARPLYIALWNAEQGARVFPRDLLYVTPAPGDDAVYNALEHFDVGDDVAINVGADFGLELADSQRVYGFTKTWSRQGVAKVSELLTSAEVAYG